MKNIVRKRNESYRISWNKGKNESLRVNEEEEEEEEEESEQNSIDIDVLTTIIRFNGRTAERGGGGE